MKFRSTAVHRRPARRLRDVKMAGMNRKADDRLHLTLSIQPATVSDISIPLGGFANIHVAHAAPALPGMPRTAQRIKSTPAVLRRAAARWCFPAPDARASASANLPLYSRPSPPSRSSSSSGTTTSTRRTFYSASRPSTSPRSSRRGRRWTSAERRRTARSRPSHSLRPMSSRRPCRRTHQRASARHCALLDVVITLELKPPTPPPPPQPPQSQQQMMMLSGAEQQAGVGGIYPLKAGSMTNQKAVSRTRGGAASGASADYATRQSAAVANLAAWRKREEEKFRQQLKEKEEEALKRLSREWALHENQRAAEARSQVRCLCAALPLCPSLSLSLSLSDTHRSCALPC